MAPPTTSLVGQPSSALGAGFVNCFALSDTDPAWVTLHGTGLGVCGGDVWGKAGSAPDPNRSNAPGGLRYWQSGHGGMKSPRVLGVTLSYAIANRVYAFHGGDDGKGGVPNSGYVAYSNNGGLDWTEVFTGGAPSNYQHNNPRAVGQTILARAVAGKDQILIAGYDGVYVSQDVTAGSGGLSKVALGDSGGAGLVCVGLVRDPNNPDIIYVATRGNVGGSSRVIGLWKITVNSAGTLVGSPSNLVQLKAEEVFAVNEGGTTAVYVVGQGGVVRWKAGASTIWNGNLPTAPGYSSVHGFNQNGTTTLVVGNGGNAGAQIWWARFDQSSSAAPAWTPLDTASSPDRVGSYAVYGRPAGENYWIFGPGGKTGYAGLGKGNGYFPSQIIALPKGSNSAEIYVAGRACIYGLFDAATTSVKWQVCSVGTNGSVAWSVASAASGGAKFAHGDADYLITTSETGYQGVQPRMHAPWNCYGWCLFYDGQDGLYAGTGPNGGDGTNGKVCYHPAPHDHTYSNTTDGNGWMNWATPGSGNRARGICGFYDSNNPNTRIILCSVYNDATYRRVDTVTSRDANGKPKTWNVGNWAQVGSLSSGGTALVTFARSSNATYCLDPQKGLMRSDDLGATFALIDGSFTGSSCVFDHDRTQSGNTIAIGKPGGVWLIADAKNSPNTKTQIAATRIPTLAGIAFDRDTTYSTSGKSRLYIFNGAPSGGNASLYYSDDYGTTWVSAGGPALKQVAASPRQMAASAGFVVFADPNGGVSIAAPSSAPTDTTAPTPNPLTGGQITATGPNSVTMSCTAAVDLQSGIGQYTWFVSKTGAAGSYSQVGNPTSGPLITVTDYTGTLIPSNNNQLYGKVQVSDQVGNVTTLSAAFGPATTPAQPTGVPTMQLNSAIVTDPAGAPTTLSVDWAGSTGYDSGVISWGDGSSDTFTSHDTNLSHAYAAYGNYSVSITGTNSFGTCDPLFLPVLLVNPIGPMNTAPPLQLAYALNGDPVQGSDFWQRYCANLDLMNAWAATVETRLTAAQAQIAANTAAITALQGGGGGSTVKTWATPWGVGANTGGTGKTTIAAKLPTGITGGRAYAVLMVKMGNGQYVVTPPTGWTLKSPAGGTSNGNGSDTMLVYERTLIAGDSGATVTWTIGTAALMCLAIGGVPDASGLDANGIAFNANQSSPATTNHPIAAATTLADNELCLLAVGGRFSTTAGRSINPPDTTNLLWADNTSAGDNSTAASNNMWVALWWELIPKAGAIPSQAVQSGAGAFSVAATAPLVHS